jgi:hypothetical protein
MIGGVAAAAGFVFLGNAFTNGTFAGHLISQIDQATESHQSDYAVYPPQDTVHAQPVWTAHRPSPVTDLSVARAPQRWGWFGKDSADLWSRGPNSKLEDTANPSFAIEDEGVKLPKSATLSRDVGGKSDAALAILDDEKRANKGKEMDDLVRKVEPLAESPAPIVPNPTQTPPPIQDNRKIIRTADVDLEVESYETTSTKLNGIVADEKGFVATANTSRLANGKIRAVVTVRVPPERFDSLILKLRDLGTIRHQNLGSQDITKAYVDLEARRAAKEAFLERLKKLLAEAKGSAKELLEVEVQMGKTIEEIEAIKGELKYYDNQVALSTLTLTISEKDLGQPFEYVQTLQSNIGLTARDADDAYAKAQKEIADAGGQVVDSKMNRQSDGSATGTIRARVDAEKFPALREALKKLGRVTNDTVNQQKTARGGHEGTPKADAPLKKEQAVVDLTITTPPIVVTHQAKLLVESPAVQDAYAAARKAVEAVGGKILNGSLVGRATGAEALVVGEVDAEKFAALVEQLKTTGKLKNSAVKHDLPAATPDGQAPLLRERATVELTLVSPPELIGEEHGIVKTIKETFAGSWKAILWSIEKLFVGLSLAGPWLALLLAGWLVWRRVRKKKPGVA